MSSEWVPFTDLLSTIVDNRGRTCPVGDTGIPLIATNCIDSSSLYPRYDTTRFVSEETYRTWFRGHPMPGDILFVCKGSPGRTNWVPNPVDFCIAQDMVSVRADPKRIYPKYLFAALRSSVVQTQIDNMHVGTMIPHFKKGDFGKLNIPVLCRDAQHVIGDFYFTLSERITLLRETNATLEAIAQALFKSWFVDFDPVRAKQQGRAPEGMDEATAALFPDGFEESELGPVPRGWRVAQFADFIERQSVGKKYDQKSAKAMGTVPILDQGKSGVIGFHDDKPGLTASLDEPVVVFANHTCYMRLITFPFSAIQNVLPFKGKGVDTVWAYYATQGRVKFSEYKGHWPDFAIEKAPLPDEQLTVKFREAVDPLVRRMKANDEQAENLAELRDTLLPRLISGQLRLPDVSLEVFG